MRGFTLIEVAIAALIIMLGVIGFTTLQTQYMRSDTDINLRNVAMKLAQQKSDDLQQFEQLATAPGVFAYQDIADNQGGSIDAGNVIIDISENASRQYTFNRSWQVVDRYFVDTNGDGEAETWMIAADPNLPADVSMYPSQKQVTITVQWNGLDNVSQSIALTSNVAPIPQGRSFQAKSETPGAKATPKVDFEPGQTPDVISYDLGDNKRIETSKPVPDIDNQGENTVVQFETVRYIELGDDADKLEQEDFLTVNCACELAGQGTAKTPHMTTLNDADELVVEPGTELVKTIGVPDGNSQSSMCDSCCRNHHDTASMIAEETFYRAELGSAHRHYKRNNNGTFSLASSAGDEYDEVCRFKRVDGFFELYPDWQLVNLIEFSDGYLSEDAKLDAYIQFAETSLKASLQNDPMPTAPADRDLEVPAGAYQLIGRGIYLDRMLTSHKARVIELINANDLAWKSITPFYDVNLTLLANWGSDNEDAATVTNEPVETIVDPQNDFYGTYSRGRLEALADGVAKIGVLSLPHNSSVTGTPPISPVSVQNILIDNSLTVTVDSQSNNERFFALIGNVNCLYHTVDNFNNPIVEECETSNDRKNTYVDLSVIDMQPNNGSFNCEMTIPRGKTTPFYSCNNVSENWNGYIDILFTVPNKTVVIKIEYPNGQIVESTRLTLLNQLNGTSNGEYNLIIEVR